MQHELKLIAIGLALSTKQRKQKIELLNQSIDACADAIRSSSDLDGMPHGNSVGNPVASRADRIEQIEEERDAEQNRVNAVEWAEQYVRDIYSEKEGDALIEAIYISLEKKGGREALQIINAKTNISERSFFTAKSQFLTQILVYLHLTLY